ncbi:hypothetical protein [Flavobacterium piscis]|uniref:Uncharacterized protein n=1 Tax=Flavobacterium piscis TaxID=1114874 RepID=A0ABU1YD90_9FLAO|nr:hypothetical protein [Flavobacterium piscis]MDR7212211.1 hypothetical protein [Flavobacterium piscis]
MKNHLKNLNRKKIQNLKKTHAARQDWNSLRELSKDIFFQIKTTARNVKYYDSLYIIDDQDPMLQRTKNFSNFIQFYLGKRPSGRFYHEFNEEGQLINSDLEVINGGAFIISQTPEGKVKFVFIPDTIENQQNQQPVILSVFKNPGKVKYHHIKEAAEDFLSYILLTSPDYITTNLEKLELYMITKKYKKDIIPSIKLLFTVGLRIMSFSKGIFIT